MPKKKVTLAYITERGQRRATMKKRRKGLLKKVSELATLCDVEACAVVYSPEEEEERPEVWPSEEEARRILGRLRSMPETEQSKRMVDREGYLRQQMAKAEEQVRRVRRENDEMEMMLMVSTTSRGWVGEMGLEDVVAVERMIEETEKAVVERMAKLQENKDKGKGKEDPVPVPVLLLDDDPLDHLLDSDLDLLLNHHQDLLLPLPMPATTSVVPTGAHALVVGRQENKDKGKKGTEDPVPVLLLEDDPLDHLLDLDLDLLLNHHHVHGEMTAIEDLMLPLPMPATTSAVMHYCSAGGGGAPLAAGC